VAVEVVASAPLIEQALEEDEATRPTEPLPFRQLLQISVYWLGINAIMGGIGIAIQERIPDLVPIGEKGTYIAIQGFAILWVNILVQPTIGMISDYTVSRWGRRKPYIAIGATLDVVFIIGVATSNTYVSLVAFLFLLQFSSNFAQGPFQGYVPDLVPEKQVGLASAMVGAMQTIGFIVGGIVVSLAYLVVVPPAKPDFTIPLIVLGVIEFLTAMGTVIWVREGGAPRPRRGRSWLDIARSAWATDILRERSFVYLVLSRLMFFAGINVLTGWFVIFMNQTLRPAPEDRFAILSGLQKHRRRGGGHAGWRARWAGDRPRRRQGPAPGWAPGRLRGGRRVLRTVRDLPAPGRPAATGAAPRGIGSRGRLRGPGTIGSCPRRAGRSVNSRATCHREPRAARRLTAPS
jgi:hypothetical protein